LERDIRRRGAFSLYWDLNAFSLINEECSVKNAIINKIKDVSLRKKFPDGSLYTSISIEQIINLSDFFQLSGRQIEMAALDENIIPEHYVRNMKTFSRASIVGLGGLGGAVTEILARIGIGTLTLIEADTFEESNLNRQFLSTHRLLDTSKTKAAIKRVREINPTITIEGHDELLDDNNAASLTYNSDVIVDCLDNIQTRFVLESAAKKVGSPLVSAAVAGVYGHVISIFPEDKGLRLIYGDSDILPQKGVETSLGCLPHAVTLLAALETSEVVKILLKKGSVLKNKLCIIDLMDNIFEVLDLL
jgi:molybdopterin/thiamine biosynthesis adenylyltransferase